MSIKKFFHPFIYATQGLIFAFKKERNFRFHIFFCLFIFWFGIVLGLSPLEWIIVFIMVGLVIAAELFNTAVEETCNVIKDKLKLVYKDTYHPRNLAAAAVLVTAITAALVGLFIFVPKIFLLFF